MSNASDIPLRDRLISCALLLLEQGEADVSLRAVAREAKVSAMAPYRHFADKEALMAAVAQRGFAELEARAHAADAAPVAGDALIAQGQAYVGFARSHPALFRLMFADGAGQALPKEDCAGAYAILANRVAQMAPDRASEGALACWALVHGLAMLALDGRLDLTPEAESGALRLLAHSLSGDG